MSICSLRDLVSTEFIAVQKDLSLRNNIIEVIKSLRQRSGVSSDDLKNSSISEIVRRKTGMDIEFRTVKGDKPYFACAILHDIRSDNPITNIFEVKNKDVSGYNKVLYEDLLRKYKTLEAGIDISRARVSGLFTKFKSVIELDYRYLKVDSMITPEETVSIILHEMGHVFCNFLYTLETVKTNVVLSALNRYDYFNSTKEKKINILTELNKDTGVKIEDMDNVVTLSDELEYTVLIKNIIDSPRSELKNPIYDLRTNEFISDQFVVMHGGGGDLATALHKIYKSENYFIKHKQLEHAKMLFKSLGLMIKNFLKLAAIMIFRKSIYFFILLAIKDIVMVKTDVVLYKLYDDPLVRIRKLKEQSLMMLKDRSLSDERKKDILEDIETVDRLLEASKEIPYYPDVMAKIFVPWIRKNDKVAKLQHDYEKLVNNPLYAHSAKMTII